MAPDDPVEAAPARSRRSLARRPGVLVPVLVALLAVVTITGARLIVTCAGDPGCFVVAGAQFTDPVQSGLPVLSAPDDDGYDGQFFWRLSRSPDALALDPVHGVTLDSPIRIGRPAYPAVVWALSGGGREGVVDWVLIGVNVVATGLLSLLLAVLARRHGVSPWVGAMAALWPGLLFAVGRDLSEPGSALLVAAGLAAAGRDRPGLAGSAWAAAVLWREQALVVPAAYGCWWLFTLLRSAGPARSAAARSAAARSAAARSAPAIWGWLAPLAALLTWQAVAAGSVGEVPLLASGASNVVLPLTGLAPELVGWLRLEQGVAGLVWLAELALAATVVLAAVVVGVRARRWEVLAVVGGAALLLSASGHVWSGPAHLRYASDLVAAAWFVLVTTERPSGTERRPAAARWLRPVGGVLGGLVVVQLGTAALAASHLVRTP